MTTRILRLALVLVVALATTAVLPSAARADRTEPARSGTIVGGAGLDSGDPSGCEYAADCLPWLQAGCNPALAGLDPVPTTSIVNVADLADGRTPRSLDMVAPYLPPWGWYPGVVIQFWRQDCTEIEDAKRHSIGGDSKCEYPRGLHNGPRCRFQIPTEARWLTLSGYATTVHLSWTLA